jgi:glycoside/pentoside/hexuronide:cation symporter, GPH family
MRLRSGAVTRPRNRSLIAYAGPGIPVAALGLPLVIYLPPYYAGQLGLDLATVGFIFFLVRAIDVPLDPLIGHWIDGTRSRWGRFRPWLVAGGLVMAAATVAVFFAAPGVTALYLFLWALLLYAGQSMLNVSHMAWGATLSPDYHQRSRVYSFWIGGHLVGLITVLILPAVLGQMLGEAAPEPVHLMGWFIIAVVPLTIGLALAAVREVAPGGEHPRITLADVRRLGSSRPLLLILLADVLVNLAPGVTGALFRFVFEQALGFSSSEAAIMLLIYFISGLLCLPLWLALAKRIGKHRAAAAAALVGAAAHVGAFLLFDPSRPALSAVAIAVAGIPYAAPGFLLRAMLADFGDEERLAGGADRIALLNAMLTTAQKVGYAIPVGILFPVLALVGFTAEPGVVNTPEALAWVERFWLFLPVALLLPAAAVLARVPLDAARLAAVQASLAGAESR